jgi:hypothetical protein|tara:strand:- start:1485 stop:1721 length:237 start_codon:yes stop_codon:yes gene_type:complete
MRRTFQEYIKQWEDSAANSVGNGGVSMPSDMMPKDKHKKHKDNNKIQKRIYDGRTKEGRKFVERIMAKRAAREAAKNK